MLYYCYCQKCSSTLLHLKTFLLISQVKFKYCFLVQTSCYLFIWLSGLYSPDIALQCFLLCYRIKQFQKLLHLPYSLTPSKQKGVFFIFIFVASISQCYYGIRYKITKNVHDPKLHKLCCYTSNPHAPAATCVGSARALCSQFLSLMKTSSSHRFSNC